MTRPLVVDFETKAIQPRPNYPPEPVGLALGRAGKHRYYPWGHTPDAPDPKARAAALTALSKSRQRWLMHNASFDIAVAMERFGLPFPDDFDDTLFLAALVDPYSPSLSLKPLSERYLGMPPEEQDAVWRWLVDNKVIRRTLKKRWGGHICDAPSAVVDPYAVGDTTRTEGLFDHLYPQVVARGMKTAYEREKALLPMLLDNERHGIPINTKLLTADLEKGEAILADLDAKLQNALGITKLDSNEQLADALEKKLHIALPLTEAGNRRTSKDVLLEHLPNGKVKGWLLYRSALHYSLKNFLRPWHAMFTEEGSSVIHTKWNQMRGTSERKGSGGGAVTGRLSSEPNLQNMTNEEKYDDLQKTLTALLGGTQWLPTIRRYVEAPKGWVLFDSDFSQQELRLLAHFEGGVLCQAYNDDPDMDVHLFVRDLIKDVTGREYDRKKRIKPVNFGKIYGAGARQLAAQMGCSIEESYEVIAAHEAALPSVVELQQECSNRGRAQKYRDKNGRLVRAEPEGIRTIGGRFYLAEPPKIINGRLRSFEYRLINYLIQGSAGDQTKQAMIDWYNDRLKGREDSVKFLLTVHDQLVGMCRVKELKREKKALESAMIDAFKLDVPVRVTTVTGQNWGAMK